MPSDDICRELGQKLRKKLRKKPRYDEFKQALGVVKPRTLFEYYPRDLFMPSIQDGSEDPLLTALDNLTWVDPRQRSGGSPVQQWIDPVFVEAALSELSRRDRDRFIRLQGSGIFDRLVTKEFLTEPGRAKLQMQPDPDLGLTVPPDFCDDGKNGLDLGLGDEFKNARKVCYGIFRAQFPALAVDATYPGNWHDRCPEFWLRSDVLATAERQSNGCDYQAGLLEEMVSLPNFREPFGPVLLNFVRTTAVDRTWSYLTYQLSNQDRMKVNQGWYIVLRRPGSVNAAIMLKVVEFYGDNEWLDSVCETGLMDGARQLVGVDRRYGGFQGSSAPAPGPASGTKARQDGPERILTGVLGDYFEGCRDRWDEFGRNGVDQVKQGLAEFESNPLRFGWVDNVFKVVDHSTSLLSGSTSSWVNVVQQRLPEMVDRAREAAAARASMAAGSTGSAGTAAAQVGTAAGSASTPVDPALTAASAIAAGWRTALGIYKVGYDLSRAVIQNFGPGIGTGGTTIIEGLDELVRTGRLVDFLRRYGVTEVGVAMRKLYNTAPRARSVAEFDADLDSVIRIYAPWPSTPKKRKSFVKERMAFAQAVWEAGSASSVRTAGP